MKLREWMRPVVSGLRAASLGLVGVLLGACERKPANEPPEMQGIDVIGLVEAKDAPLLDLAAGDFVEAVWDEGVWVFYQQSVRMAANPLSAKSSGIAWLVISAPGDAKAETVAVLLAQARAAEVARIDLLTRRASAAREARALTLTSAGDDQIQPLQINVAADGGVTIGTGPSEASFPALAQLKPTLEMYAAAARAAGSAPQATVIHQPETDFQRVVDVFGKLASHGILTDWGME